MTAMERETLLERLRGIEWDDFEVKEASGGVPKTAYTTVSAFANTSGGWIVLGVRESKKRFEIVGVSDPDTMQNDFLGSCRSTEKFSRPVEVRPHHFTIEGRSVLAFYIVPARRFDKPVRVRVDKAWFAYIRVAARDQKCTPEEEGRFLRDATVDTFDAQVMPSTRFEDLDETSIRWVRGLYQSRNLDRPLSDISHADFLDELGLLQDGQVTHAAALFVGKRKLIGRLKPAGIVDFRQVRLPWAKEAPAHRYDDRLLAESNLVETLQAVLGRMLNLVPNPFRLDPATLQREAHPPEYPALREALVNLLIHQDYADQHRTARILWYTDRTIFDNPGDSFVTLPEMLDGGVSDLRNPRIARLMRLIGYADQVGTGMGTILRTWREVDRTPPVIVNDPARKIYAITLSWVPVPKVTDAAWKARIGATVSSEQARLLAWLREVGTARRSEARLATGTTARETRDMVEHLLVNRLIEPVDDEGEVIRLAAHIREILDAEQVTDQAPPQVTPQATPQASPQVEGVLAVCVGEMTRDELQTHLGIADRKHFRTAYLHPALEAGLLEMTVPDKPRSPRQKYRLTDAARALLAGRPGEHQ
jgi:ATP-dependent DNA helicase RecG